MGAAACLIDTSLGPIKLALRWDAAPMTAEHFCNIVNDRLYDDCCFYRSDFVIQGGLQRMDGSGVANPHPNLRENETAKPGTAKVTNARGTAAFGHWDVPDNGNSEFFINLQHNPHLDTAYGGYCIFAEIEKGDGQSFETADKIVASIKASRKVQIR